MKKIFGAFKVINVEPFPEKKVAPDLKLGEVYSNPIEHICGCGEHHYDVGILSAINFVTCYKCGEELPDGDKIHWAHSSRFEKQ